MRVSKSKRSGVVLERRQRTTIEYVVEPVTRTHHAVVNEMPTAAAPEIAMPVSKSVRVSMGKLRSSEAADQSSSRREALMRMGMGSMLL